MTARMQERIGVGLIAAALGGVILGLSRWAFFGLPISRPAALAAFALLVLGRTVRWHGRKRRRACEHTISNGRVCIACLEVLPPSESGES